MVLYTAQPSLNISRQFRAILAKQNLYNKYYKSNTLHQLDMVAKIID